MGNDDVFFSLCGNSDRCEIHVNILGILKSEEWGKSSFHLKKRLVNFLRLVILVN